MMAAAGSDPLDIDNIFSIFLYDGTGSAQTITNGIDLSGEGGLVWTKARSASDYYVMYDTARGTSVRISSNDADGNTTDTNEVTAFNSNGYTLDSGGGFTNDSGTEYVSWTFRKSPNFFDIVTYTGTGSARTINHSLGSVPGMIWIKNLSRSESWSVYHRSTGATKHLKLNNHDYAYTDSGYFNDTTPTASVFSLGNNGQVNEDVIVT